MHNHPEGKPKIPSPKNRLKITPTSKLQIQSDEITIDFLLLYVLKLRTTDVRLYGTVKAKEEYYMCDERLKEFITYLRYIGYTEGSINRIVSKASNKISLGVEAYSKTCRLKH
jgi:hypothetical protein